MPAASAIAVASSATARLLRSADRNSLPDDPSVSENSLA